MSSLSLFLSATLIWSTTWYAIKFQIGSVPLELSVAYRFFLASILLFVFCILTKRQLRFGKAEQKFFLILSVLNFSVHYVLTYYATKYLPSGLVAVTYSLQIIINTINAKIFLGQRSDSSLFIGGFLGLAGIGLLFFDELLGFSSSLGEGALREGALYGLFLTFLGVVICSFGSIVMAKMRAAEIPVIQANAYSMLYGSIITFIYVVISGKGIAFDYSAAYLGSLLYLSFFGSVLAFGAYMSLVGKIGPARAGYITIAFPPIALLISTLFEGYLWDLYGFIGLFLILMGNVIILRNR